MSQTIDLSRLPTPQVVEKLNYEDVLEQRKATFLERTPEDRRDDFEQTINLDSEPAAIVLQENAYRELLLRNRINEAAKGCMIAFAQGADLDQLVANLGVKRLVLQAGDPTANPPTSDIYEADTDLRKRAVMALEGYPTAGSVGAYEFHAYSADADVKDVSVSSPAPGLVRLVILSRSGDGMPQEQVLQSVRAAVTADRVRPLTDSVEVVAAQIHAYAVNATLFVEPGPSPETVRLQAIEELKKYAQERQMLGAYVAISGIAAALHRPGVRRLDIQEPAGDIDPGAGGAATMGGFQIEVRVDE